jgi:hypothetical protein
MAINSASAGRFTMAQVADGPAGFANCLKLSTTTADTSIASGEILMLRQRFEGQDLWQLQKGTATAKQVAVSFYVKGNANATYTCELFDRDNSRTINQAFAVTTAWNRIELTFAADTSDPLDDDNAVSLDLQFILHGGSQFSGGTFSSNAWKDKVDDTRMAESHTSIFDATSRTFFITGVQMEVGSTATDFEHRSFGGELALCKRYFESSYPHGTVVGVSSFVHGYVQKAVSGVTNSEIAGPQFSVEKRAVPTMAIYHAVTGAASDVYRTSDGAASTVSGIVHINTNGVGYLQLSSGADNSYKYHFSADAEL